jgi:hypothetical protein
VIPARMQHRDQPYASARRRLAGPVRHRAGLLALSLMLGACVPETPSVTLAPPKGNSAERALEEFIITVVTVDLIDERCRSEGLRKTYTNADVLIERYVRGMQKQGFSLQEIERAVDRLPIDATAVKALRRVEARGVQIGDDASLCRYGKKEFAARSPIGRLLGAPS